jgi:hypothetical protein
MRMQLSKRLLQCAAVAAVSLSAASPRSEVVSFDGRTTYYREGLPYGKMQVINPSVGLGAKPWDFLQVNGGWQADIVSGASIKTRNGTRGADPDAVSTASVKDFRQVVNGGLALKRKLTTFEAGYSYSWEHDYKSHSFDVAAKAELLQRSMELSIAYARNWDQVCDRDNPDPDPTRRQALATSEGCFKPNNATTPGAVQIISRPIAIDSIQGGWTQAWTPTFTTQATFSVQLAQGFLSNPYREVNIGQSSPVQEYVPEIRIRYAAGLRANWYLKPIKTALRIGGRLYRDTWDLRSITGELELERYVLIDALRIRARGRYYVQSNAIFYSDDYLIEPRGKYFTGDRELSTMRSILAGLRIAYGPSAGANRFLGMLEKIEVSLGADYLWFNYSDFTINGEPLKKTAIIGSLGFTLLF